MQMIVRLWLPRLAGARTTGVPPPTLCWLAGALPTSHSFSFLLPVLVVLAIAITILPL